jgi:hypothetical protein
MAGFKYWTITSDKKMKGLVSAEYIRAKMIQRTIEGMGTADNGTYFELFLADGAHVNFVLNGPDGPEIQYQAPNG